MSSRCTITTTPLHSHPTLRCLAVALGLSFLCQTSFADTIILKNGDRLSGTVQLLDAGTLVLRTDYAGEIRIDWSKVAQLDTDTPVLVRAPGLPPGYHASLAHTGNDGTAQLDPAPTAPATPLPLAQVERLVRPHPLLRDWSFQGSVDLALDASHAASSNENWRIGLQTMLRRYNWRHGLTLEYRRKSQDGVVGTHQYNALYTLDRFISDRLFIQGRLRNGHDFVDEPKSENRLAIGPGYQFWDNELGAFSLTGLLTHTRYRYRNGSNPHFQSAGLSWDYTRHFGGKRWQIFTQGEAYQALGESTGRSVNAALGVRYSLTQWLSLSARTGYNRVSSAHLPSSSERSHSIGLSARW